MITTVKIQAISFKTRAIMAADEWANVAKDIDLKQFEKGKFYTLETAKGFDGKPRVLKVVDKLKEK